MSYKAKTTKDTFFRPLGGDLINLEKGTEVEVDDASEDDDHFVIITVVIDGKSVRGIASLLDLERIE